MVKFGKIVLLCGFLIGTISAKCHAGLFDPVASAGSGERCGLAKKLYTESRKNETFTKNDAAELKKIASEKSDNCLMLSAMIFLAEYEDRNNNKAKNEDSLLLLYNEALSFADAKGFEEEEADLTYRLGMKYYSMKQFPQLLRRFNS